MDSHQGEIRKTNVQVSEKITATNNGLQEKAQPVIQKSKSNEIIHNWTKKEFK